MEGANAGSGDCEGRSGGAGEDEVVGRGGTLKALLNPRTYVFQTTSVDRKILRD